MESLVATVANRFGIVPLRIEALTEGLIHKTYHVTFSTGIAIILQQVNTAVFPGPKKIIENYQLIGNHLNKNNGVKIPVQVKTLDGLYVHQEGKFFWRAFEYITDSYRTAEPRRSRHSRNR
jgi:hypothetical protein